MFPGGRTKCEDKLFWLLTDLVRSVLLLPLPSLLVRNCWSCVRGAMLHVHPVLDPFTKLVIVFLSIAFFVVSFYLVYRTLPDPDSSAAAAGARAKLRKKRTSRDLNVAPDAQAAKSAAQDIEASLKEVAEKLKIPLKQVQIYWEAFDRWDVDDSNSVSSKEVAAMLVDTMGYKPPPEEVERIVRDVDFDGDGTLQFHEFCQLASSIDMGEQSEEELREAFLLWSQNKEFISQDLMRNAMTTLGNKLSAVEFEEFMAEADANNDSQIDYAEFKRCMGWIKA